MPTLEEAAASGDRLTSLKSLRDVLARQIDSCESNRDLAALSNRFMDALASIAEIEGSSVPKTVDAPVSSVDEFTSRRKQRTGS